MAKTVAPKTAKAPDTQQKAEPPPPPATKKADPNFDRAREREKLHAQINKQFSSRQGARGMIMPADEFANMFTLRRPFGITGLDVHTAGGPPAGGLIELVGPEGGGKTYLSNLVIAGVQAAYGDDALIGLVMSEMHYDKPFAKACGVKVALSDVEIQMWNQSLVERGLPPLDPTWAKEQVGGFDEVVHAVGPGLLEAAAQMIEANIYQVIVIDSLGAIQTEDAANGSIEDRQYGGAATPITAFMKRYWAAMNMPDSHGRPNTTTVIAINQNRDNIGGGMFSVDYRIQGGNALKHGNLLTLRIHAGAKKRATVKGQENVIVGKEINWQILKGKAGCHDGVSGEYDFYYGEHGYPFGANRYKDLLSTGLEYGLIEQSGAWYSYQGERLGQGADNVALSLYQNPQLFSEIRRQIFAKANVNFITREQF